MGHGGLHTVEHETNKPREIRSSEGWILYFQRFLKNRIDEHKGKEKEERKDEKLPGKKRGGDGTSGASGGGVVVTHTKRAFLGL